MRYEDEGMRYALRRFRRGPPAAGRAGRSEMNYCIIG